MTLDNFEKDAVLREKRYQRLYSDSGELPLFSNPVHPPLGPVLHRPLTTLWWLTSLTFLGLSMTLYSWPFAQPDLQSSSVSVSTSPVTSLSLASTQFWGLWVSAAFHSWASDFHCFRPCLTCLYKGRTRMVTKILHTYYSGYFCCVTGTQFTQSKKKKKRGLGVFGSPNWKIQAQDLSNNTIRMVSLSLTLSPSHTSCFLSLSPLLLSLPLFSPKQTAPGFLYHCLAALLEK